ncbi:MAG: tRNA-dependent cyclodipeptide synthase [Nanoarchaeota archaeon]|nr:tRNA-dependent cyclodipeptide synthase [Nanoarchaeota archaeon]
MEIIQGIRGEAYETGYDILQERGASLVPVCPGNGHFNAKTIDELIRIASENFSVVIIFIPDKPTEHTYRAMGYTDAKAKQKARHQGNNLRNNTMRSIDKIREIRGITVPKIINWVNDVESQNTFQEELRKLKQLYHQNVAFHQLVRNETHSVIKERTSEENDVQTRIDEGINYVLEELAWLTTSPSLLGVSHLAYIYHKEWFLDDFIAGKYDGTKKENLGFVIIR